MQTTGSLLRTSYQYHHDYGRLDDCHSSSSSLSHQHQQQHLNNEEIEHNLTGGEHLLFFQHQHHNNQQQQQQQQPQFIQLTSGNFDNEHQLAYEEQRTTLADASSMNAVQQQPVPVVYQSAEIEANHYGQHLIESDKQTNTTNEEETVYAISNYSVEYQQQRVQAADERSTTTIYYEQSTLPTSAYANESRPSTNLNLDGNDAPSSQLQLQLQSHDHDHDHHHHPSIYCQQSILALPNQHHQLVEEPIDATSSTCNLIEQPQQIYSFHHYSTATDCQQQQQQQHHHQHSSLRSENEEAYVENCIPLELSHHQHHHEHEHEHHHHHHQLHQLHHQQVYQNLDTIPEVQKQQTIVVPENVTASPPPVQLPVEISVRIEKSNLLNYNNNSCHANQLHHSSINQYDGNNNNNDNQDCLIRGIYDVGTGLDGHESHSSAASSISYDDDDSSSEESSNSTLTRDEKRAREANLPLSYHEIVNLSIDQFNEQLARHSLTELQLQLIKDIRRRGKNKVAAQSCRKRKMEQIYELQHEVSDLANRRVSLENECNKMMREYERLVQDYNKINALVQHKLQQRQHQQQRSHQSAACNNDDDDDDQNQTC